MSSAIISPCSTYRYVLGREVLSTLTREHKPCLFVMLNPSTADAMLDDPTIRRCIGFARREGCTFLTVVNLFAYRATDPDSLVTACRAGIDIVGPDNEEHVSRELRRHNPALGHLIIAAWGANQIAQQAVGTRARLREAGALCLGMTKDGEPKHPLYLAGNAPLVPWKRAA